eukprot:1937647-Amphidinium_carterae.2
MSPLEFSSRTESPLAQAALKKVAPVIQFRKKSVCENALQAWTSSVAQFIRQCPDKKSSQHLYSFGDGLLPAFLSWERDRILAGVGHCTLSQ